MNPNGIGRVTGAHRHQRFEELAGAEYFNAIARCECQSVHRNKRLPRLRTVHTGVGIIAFGWIDKIGLMPRRGAVFAQWRINRFRRIVGGGIDHLRRIPRERDRGISPIRMVGIDAVAAIGDLQFQNLNSCQRNIDRPCGFTTTNDAAIEEDSIIALYDKVDEAPLGHTIGDTDHRHKTFGFAIECDDSLGWRVRANAILIGMARDLHRSALNILVHLRRSPTRGHQPDIEFVDAYCRTEYRTLFGYHCAGRKLSTLSLVISCFLR
jgi:hypothetical protein